MGRTAPTGIKSIQEGLITIGASDASETATISSVDTSKAYCIYGGRVSTSGGSMSPTSDLAYVRLTSATVVTATRIGTTNALNVAYTVVEHF